MTRSFWMLVTLFTLMVLMGLATMNSTVLVLTLPLMVYMVVAVFYAPGENQLRAQRILSTDRINHGGDISVSLQVDNENSKIYELHLMELATFNAKSMDGDLFEVLQLEPGESFKHEYGFRSERGCYRFEGLLANTLEPFGLFQTRERLPASGEILVFPEVSSLNLVPIKPPHTKGFTGPIQSKRSGTGIDFFGVREYQFGDSLRHINWKASARNEAKLYANEYEQERIADVGLILDARPHCDISLGGISLFEYSIQAVASLATSFLENGHCLSLLIYGAYLSRVFPGYGRIQSERVLETLSRAETGITYGPEFLHYYPARLLPPRGQLIYISPLVASDLEPLKRFVDLGYAVLIISPDPLYFEQKIEATESDPDMQLALRFAKIERELLIRDLKKAGIQVVNWRVDIPLFEVMETFRSEQVQLQRRVQVFQ